MPLKHLEHDGDEDFLNKKVKVLDRHEVAEKDKKFKEKQEKQKETDKIIAQDRWMSMENPFLWEGDFE